MLFFNAIFFLSSKISVNAICNACCHQILIIFRSHLQIFIWIGHITHLDNSHRHTCPVDAAHGVSFPHTFSLCGQVYYVASAYLTTEEKQETTADTAQAAVPGEPNGNLPA